MRAIRAEIRTINESNGSITDETVAINIIVSTIFEITRVRLKYPLGVTAQPQTNPRLTAPKATRSMLVRVCFIRYKYFYSKQ
jgi:hypothetical protein